MSEFGDNWLGKEVTFRLLGQTITGVITEALDTICASMWLVAEFYDGTKQVKVGGPYQAFRKVKEN